MVAMLVECSDHNVQYGILSVKGVSIEEVQEKIYQIKSRFYHEGFEAWCIDDVLAEFPDEWEWDFTRTDKVIEI